MTFCFAGFVYVVDWFLESVFLLVVETRLFVLVSSWFWCLYVLLVQLFGRC